MKKRLALAVGTAAMLAAVSACDTGSSAGATDTLTVNMAFGRGVVTQNFNPFSETATEGTLGFVFEPLMGVNVLKSGAYTPWLASAEQTSADGKTLTVDLNPAATWNDGAPVTADDVVFTFADVLAKYPATNYQYSVTFASVTAKDAHTVVFTFAQPAFTEIPNILSEYIVPKKYWQNQNPTTWTNPSPVGSGPYKEERLTSQEVTLTARTDYWKQKNIPVKTINFPIVNPATEENSLEQGTEDWSGGAIPDPVNDFVDKNPAQNHMFNATYGADFLFFNLEKPKFQNVHVRQAVADAIDKQQIINLVTEVGYKPISQTGLDPTTQGQWLDPAYATAITTNDQAAIAQLAQAGYTMQGGKAVNAAGQQLSFSIMEVASYADTVQKDKIIAQQLGKIGIAVTVDPEASGTYSQDRTNGNFDAITGGFAYGATPYDMYNSLLNSTYAGPVGGQNAQYDNYERYRDPATDQLLAQLAVAPTTAQQIAITKQIEKIVVTDVPFVTISSIVAGCAYTTKHWVGWPSDADPYAVCSPWYGGPYNTEIVLNLKPAS